MSVPQSRLSKLLSHFTNSSSGAPKPYEHRHHIHQLSPTVFLPRAAAIEPDAPAIYHVTSNGRELRRTYQQFSDRAKALGYYIKERGWKKVGILCPNTPAFLEAIFGIGAAGAINVAVNYRLKAEDVAYIFNHSDAEAIIVDAAFVSLLDTYQRTHPTIPLIVDDDTGDSSGDYETAISQGQALDAADGSRGWAGLQTEVANEDETIALAYTSGTTGRPKGVEYTSRGSYLAAVANVIESGLNYESGRCRFLWTLPLFHAMGWTFPWAVTAARGTHYCLRAIDYPIIWRLLKEEKITHYNAAPTVNTLLCAAKEAGRLEQPVRVTVAASPPTPALFERMESLNLYPVHVFGMTETYGPITKGYRLPQWEELEAVEKYRKMARQGHGFVASLPIRVVKVKKEEGEYGEGDEVLVDVKQDGKEIGEIVCLGNICAKGYYKDPEATRKLFKGGVLHTGDLAVWHEDGSAQILDRAKDVIISGGENISSVSLESMLATHPDILEAAVVAVADKQWGERPKAYVTVQEGKTLQGEDVIKWAKGNSAISGFMVPREVEVVEELPKTSTGKVKKNVLREWTKGAARES